MSAYAYRDSSAAGGATMLASAIGAHLGVPSPERLRRFIEAAMRNPDTARNRNPHRYLGFKDKDLLTKQAGFDLEHVTYRLAVVLPRRPDGLILFSHDDAFGRIHVHRTGLHLRRLASARIYTRPDAWSAWEGVSAEVDFAAQLAAWAMAGDPA